MIVDSHLQAGFAHQRFEFLGAVYFCVQVCFIQEKKQPESSRNSTHHILLHAGLLVLLCVVACSLSAEVDSTPVKKF